MCNDHETLIPKLRPATHLQSGRLHPLPTAPPVLNGTGAGVDKSGSITLKPSHPKLDLARPLELRAYTITRFGYRRVAAAQVSDNPMGHTDAETVHAQAHQRRL